MKRGVWFEASAEKKKQKQWMWMYISSLLWISCEPESLKLELSVEKHWMSIAVELIGRLMKFHWVWIAWSWKDVNHLIRQWLILLGPAGSILRRRCLRYLETMKKL